MATAQGQVAPASTLPGAVQQAGTFPTEQARAEAAIKAFNDVATTYPGTDAALAASYHAASELLAAGRPAEAETAFAAVVAAAGSSLYAPLARLGQAEAMSAAGKIDEALKIYSDLSAARDGALPVDALLMQLGRVSLKAGKTGEARAAFKRVVDEFPESGYLADAREQLAATN
jgi:TolA-binding protein